MNGKTKAKYTSEKFTLPVVHGRPWFVKTLENSKNSAEIVEAIAKMIKQDKIRKKKSKSSA